MNLKIKDIWDRNGQFAIKHWGKLKSEPFSDFSRTFGSK